MRKASPAVLALIALAACGKPGAADYNAGLEAAKLGSHDRAAAQYEAAVAADPEFAEAYHNLAASEIRLARDAAVAQRDAEAGKFWRSCVAHRRRALELMNQDKFRVLKGEARDAKKADLERQLKAVERVEKFGMSDDMIGNALRSMALDQLR